MLVAIGILDNGQRSVLGVSVSLSEAEVHWRTFLKHLIDRGLHGIQMIVSDDHSGLKQARKACFPGIAWQRCQFHLMQNALHYVPQVTMRSEVTQDLRSVFHAPDRHEADRLLKQLVKKYEASAPTCRGGWKRKSAKASRSLNFRPPSGVAYGQRTCWSG